MSILNEALHKIDLQMAARKPAPDADIAPDAAAGVRAANDDSDRETMEVVHRFEEIYSELAPVSAPAGRDEQPGLDDLVIELPEGPPDDAPRVERWAAGRVDIDGLHRGLAVQPRRPQARRTAEAELSVDDALALLRASEKSGGVAESGARDKLDEPAARTPAASAQVRRPAMFEGPAPVTEPRTSQDRASRMQALAAAVVALAVGAALGYVGGKGAAPEPQNKIQSTPQGGAQLRLELDLKGR